MVLLPFVFALLGIAAIPLAIAAYVANRHAERDGRSLPRFWLGLDAAALVIGGLAAIASWPLTYLLGYPVPEGDGFGRVVGLPFFVAYFDAQGLDYIGPIAIVSVIGNAVFWLLAPQIPLWLYRRLAR